ncbi:MAG: alpha-hydroxy-acid oxidizing protein [Chitinophagaceae bacterium]|nr:alpha-hydroxy-acid oxidizing protein [Chitinophagaceae bacterium]
MSISYNPNYPSVDYLRRKAKRRIPGFAFDYLEGGCNEEVNLQKNASDIQRVELIPKYCCEYESANLQTELFGHTYSLPFGIAPVGLQGLIWPGAPEILAKAAFENNIPFILSTVSTSSIERIAEITEGRAWYQLYHPVENTITDDLLQRAQSAGYPVLVVLADVPSFGYRHKEIRNGLAMPPRMTLRNMVQIVGRPHWALQTLLHGQPSFATLKPYMQGGMNMRHLGLFMNRTFNGRLNHDKVARLRDRWKGKLVLKGVASEEDAAFAVRMGLDGIIVSNHGGRQLDAGESSISSLKRIRPVCENKLTVMIDSGIRSGVDIARVLANKADFAFLGRSFMYGVAALGKKGGQHTIAILNRQLQQVMEQLSCRNITELPDRLAGNRHNL